MYGFLFFAKNIGENFGKTTSKNLTVKYGPCMLAMLQKILDHAKESATDSFKTASKRAIQKAAKATGYLIGNEIADAVSRSYDSSVTKVSKNPQ